MNNKKLIAMTLLVTLALTLSFAFVASAGMETASAKSKNTCTTIRSGELETTDGRVIKPGYDEWGYNYQARTFNGTYCDAYRDAGWCQSYKDVKLKMKWNDAWLSNKDCDGDGLLDRHFGYGSYIGSGAWLTNHQSGVDDGKQWNYFVKIVAAPANATKSGGNWYTANGKKIGPVIWGDFAVIQEVSNDQGTGEHGILYKSKAPTGFGFYKP